MTELRKLSLTKEEINKACIGIKVEDSEDGLMALDQVAIDQIVDKVIEAQLFKVLKAGYLSPEEV